MVLKFVIPQNFWTVVTMYFKEGQIDGEVIGAYQDTLPDPPATPTFSIRPVPPAPIVRIKRRRRIFP